MVKKKKTNSNTHNRNIKRPFRLKRYTQNPLIPACCTVRSMEHMYGIAVIISLNFFSNKFSKVTELDSPKI